MRRVPGGQRLAPRRVEAAGARAGRDAGSGRCTRGATFLHPDFGPPSYGIPYDVVDAAHADVCGGLHVRERERSGPVPVRTGHPRRGRLGPARDHDRSASDCTLYELFAARWNGGDPTAGSGRDLPPRAEANALRPAGWTSADAAGLPIFAGLLRYDEVAAGMVDHAIRMTAAARTTPTSGPRAMRPGRSDRRCPPMGARFRLKAGFDVSGFSAERPRRAPRDEALRADRGRQRQRLVLPGHRRPALDLRASSIS